MLQTKKKCRAPTVQNFKEVMNKCNFANNSGCKVCSKSSTDDDSPYVFWLILQEAITRRHIKPLWRLFPAPAVRIVLHSVCGLEARLGGNGAVCTDGSPQSPTSDWKGRKMVGVCAALSLRSHLSQSVFRYGRSSMHVRNVRVSVWESTAWLWLLTLALWQSEHSAVLTIGSPAPPASLSRMNINNSKWSQSCLPLRLFPMRWDHNEMILPLHERPPRGKRQRMKKVWRAAKRHPGVCAISSTRVKGLERIALNGRQNNSIFLVLD